LAAVVRKVSWLLEAGAVTAGDAALPQPGKGEGRAIAADEERLPVLLLATPLAEAIGRHEAAALGEGLGEFRRHRPGAQIDHRRAERDPRARSAGARPGPL
jgi:hypothetical protein